MSENKEEKAMSPTTLAKIAEKKKQLTPERKSQMIKAGGSIKTRNYIDAQEICREVRGK
ncbi:hypothetical protein SAMN05661091_1020 [Paenibacillus uliginis N3/975]|uniref:Uncharacterized protein n=1 Tax=Paenibacillus uliginis N3/975 TaxID=1313296 RepID=A0A1X7GSH0_9BACL|nr:hypothetical protein [Paenibacillus uliginis]SMF73915.1 hypothetical protein SAMN05661091_1020 [Paenibacillus uliginis N3/975]